MKMFMLKRRKIEPFEVPSIYDEFIVLSKRTFITAFYSKIHIKRKRRNLRPNTEMAFKYVTLFLMTRPRFYSKFH